MVSGLRPQEQAGADYAEYTLVYYISTALVVQNILFFDWSAANIQPHLLVSDNIFISATELQLIRLIKAKRYPVKSTC